MLVHHEQFFHAVFVQDQLSLFERGAHGHRDQILTGHHVAHGNLGARFKAQIAIGEDAHQPLALRDGHAGDAIAAHDFERVADGLFRADGHGIDNHAALRTLHLVDFASLVGDGEVAVHDADAALLRHGDGHARLGDRIHSRGKERGVERNPLCQLSLRAYMRGHHLAVGGHQQDIVERKSFRKIIGQHNV